MSDQFWFCRSATEWRGFNAVPSQSPKRTTSSLTKTQPLTLEPLSAREPPKSPCTADDTLDNTHNTPSLKFPKVGSPAWHCYPSPKHRASLSVPALRQVHEESFNGNAEAGMRSANNWNLQKTKEGNLDAAPPALPHLKPSKEHTDMLSEPA